MRSAAALLAFALVATVGCGEEPRGERLDGDIEAQLPTSLGELWELCPPPDIPEDLYGKESRETRRATRALIGAVRRNPNAVVTLVSYDAHDGKTYRDPVTVRELAEEHLDNPGVRAVPCQRRLMLGAPSRGRGSRRTASGRRAERAGLSDRGGRQGPQPPRGRSGLPRPQGCEIDFIYGSRSELEPTLRDGPPGNHGLVTDPDQTVGVQVYKPSAACVRELERRLAALAAR